jgi:Flp pilus assembly protein TadG
MRLYRACGAGDESGVALVEFALVVPILLVLLLGMLDFGKVLNYWIDETQLASSGARWAVVNAAPGVCPDSSTPTSLQAYIQCQADTRELREGGTNSVKVADRAKVCISFPPVSGHSSPLVGDPVRVTVSVGYTWLPLVSQRLGIAVTNIKGSSTMRLEAPPTYTAGCYPA